MNEYYLTDELYIKDNKLFYQEKLVKNHNWQFLLKEYGWEKLHKKWIKKLNSFRDKPLKNSLFGSLDCGGEGDCLFHCISHAFKYNDIDNISNNDTSYLRNLLSESITEDKFN